MIAITFRGFCDAITKVVDFVSQASGVGAELRETLCLTRDELD